MTSRFCRALAGRSAAVASAKILPLTSESSSSVTRARPSTYSTSVTLPTGLPATAAEGPSAGSSPLASGKITSTSYLRGRERQVDVLLRQRVADEDRGADDLGDDRRPPPGDAAGLEPRIDEVEDASHGVQIPWASSWAAAVGLNVATSSHEIPMLPSPAGSK